MKKILNFVLIFTFVLLFFNKDIVQALEFKSSNIVSLNKVWTVKFNKKLDPATVNSNNVYVADSTGKKVDVVLKIINNNQWISVAPKNNYNPNTTYKLYVTTNVKDETGKNLKEVTTGVFTTGNSVDDKIVLGWNYIHDKASNLSYYNDESDYIRRPYEEVGVNIMSPTWFELSWSNKEINGVLEKIDLKYLENARNNGYEVWPTVQQLPNFPYLADQAEYEAKFKNMFENDILEQKIINQLVSYCKEYNFSGINMDFEAMGKTNRDGYTVFMSKLYDAMKKEGIKVSVDVNEPVLYSPYSECYDRPSLAKFVDYMMFMAYDEHWTGDPESGSVGSYPWVESGIQRIINSGVPANKLVLGVPFYMRDFAVIEVNPNVTSVAVTKRTSLYASASLSSNVIKSVTYGETYKFLADLGSWYEVEYNGGKAYIDKYSVKKVDPNKLTKIAVGWKAINRNSINNIISNKAYGASIYYDDKAMQDVLVYYDYDSANTVKLKHEVWLENEKSLKWRIELINKYGLKGVAAWQMPFATEELLNVIRQYNFN